jgi:hypothetical protein
LAPLNTLKLALLKTVVVLRRSGRAKANIFWGKSCVFCAQDGFKRPLNWLRMLNVVTQINGETRSSQFELLDDWPVLRKIQRRSA